MKKLLAVVAAAAVAVVIGALAFRSDRKVETANVPGRPVDTFERRGIPTDGADASDDEPAMFFPEAKESDHNESANGEYDRQLKGDTKDYLSYVKGETGGFRGRSPGVYDNLGVGGVRDTDGKIAKTDPKDAPSDVRSAAHGTNPFILSATEKLSTFGLDVTTASYTLARTYLTRGKLPPADAVRVEEFVELVKKAQRIAK